MAKKTDFFPTLESQGRWNRYGAIFTAVAVACQAIASALSDTNEKRIREVCRDFSCHRWRGLRSLDQLSF
jgi:hypothetical protein